MRTLILIALVAGCGDGSRGGSIVAPIDQPQMDGVDEGEAIDYGGGVPAATGELFEPCHKQEECGRGSCIQPDAGRVGLCIAICAAPRVGGVEELGGVRVEPCLRAEECVVLSSGAGLCLRACATSADCPANTMCGRLEASVAQLFCVPFFSSSGPVEETPVEPAPSPG